MCLSQLCVAEAQPQQEKQLIYKHDAQTLVETFHKPGRILVRQMSAFLLFAALFVCVCHRAPFVFGKFC